MNLRKIAYISALLAGTTFSDYVLSASSCSSNQITLNKSDGTSAFVVTAGDTISCVDIQGGAVTNLAGAGVGVLIQGTITNNLEFSGPYSFQGSSSASAISIPGGVIGTILVDPAGTINLNPTGSGGGLVGIYDRGTIGSVDNYGVIGGLSTGVSVSTFMTGIYLSEAGSIGSIFNRVGATIYGLGRSAIDVDGGPVIHPTVTTINNSGSIIGGTSAGNPDSFAPYTTTAGAITNTAAVIGSISSGTGIINNAGALITGGEYASGISNRTYRGWDTPGGTIYSILNYGTISTTSSSSNYAGISNYGSTINTITNYGTISSASGYGIINTGVIMGVIGTINNAQGAGNPSGPLTYTGGLPSNYNIIINSPASFGRLAVTSGTGGTTFGIYAGSTVHNGIYASVITGLALGNLTATTGTFGAGTWTLSNASGAIWDLILSGYYPSTADTQASLVNTSSALQSSITLQNTVLVNGFTYDCAVFDKNGICVSAGGRNTTVSAGSINNTSGLLIGSYRLDANNSRVGLSLDQNFSTSMPGGTIKQSNNTPMVGVFGIWQENLDTTGWQAKLSAGMGQKDTTIQRTVVGTSEPGVGSATMISQGAQAMGKYGFAVMDDVLILPYAGVRYTRNNMGGYTEATSSSVTAPLTMNKVNTNSSAALIGVEGKYKVMPDVTVLASGGVERNMSTNYDNYIATSSSITGLTPISMNPNMVRTRPTASLGAYYDVEKNQRLGINAIYRQEMYQAVGTTTVMATYTVGL